MNIQISLLTAARFITFLEDFGSQFLLVASCQQISFPLCQFFTSAKRKSQVFYLLAYRLILACFFPSMIGGNFDYLFCINTRTVLSKLLRISFRKEVFRQEFLAWHFKQNQTVTDETSIVETAVWQRILLTTLQIRFFRRSLGCVLFINFFFQIPTNELLVFYQTNFRW